MWSSLATSSASAFALPAFIIALIGLIGSVTALVWQFTMYRLTGSRIKVELRQGWIGGGGLKSLNAKREPTDEELRELEHLGYTKRVINIQVRSVGRLAANITNVRFQSSVEYAHQPLFRNTGPDLPHMMAHGEVASWHAKPSILKDLRSRADRDGKLGRVKLWAEVDLGDGRSVRSKEKIVVPRSSKEIG